MSVMNFTSRFAAARLSAGASVRVTTLFPDGVAANYPAVFRVDGPVGLLGSPEHA